MNVVEAVAARQVVYLTKDEVERFFSAIPADNARDRLLFDVIYRYGLRRREASLIRREHLSEGRVWITRVKRGIPGEYPIHPATRRLLWAHLNERGDDGNPYLFTSRQSRGGSISPSTIYALFRRYADVAGIARERQHPHVLRHSIATHLRNAGWDVADVQDWIGHRHISSTMIYSAVTNTRREAVYKLALLLRRSQPMMRVDVFHHFRELNGEHPHINGSIGSVQQHPHAERWLSPSRLAAVIALGFSALVALADEPQPRPRRERVRPPARRFYLDADRDGYGAGAPRRTAKANETWVRNNTDCDDTNPRVYENRAEPTA